MKVAERYQGMFWHVHHDKLMELSDDIRERINYIKKEKPKSEVETRLKLMKKVEGKIPEQLAEAYAKRKEAYAKRKEAYAKWEEAYAKREEAYAKREEAYAKWEEAYAKWKEADAKWAEADAKFLPELEKLHKIECGCKEWKNGSLNFSKG